jgi:hypothetical protein
MRYAASIPVVVLLLAARATVGQAQVQPAPPNVESILADWAAAPREAANAMIAKYGQPAEVTASQLVWHDTGPFAHTIVSREEIPHSFPMEHTDLLEQVINYRVPPDKFDELAEYDGSVIAERTKGTLSARCDKEAMNFLALNLAHDIITGERSVEDAREFYAETAAAFKRGETSEYTQGLRFEVSQTPTGDPDKPFKK